MLNSKVCVKKYLTVLSVSVEEFSKHQRSTVDLSVFVLKQRHLHVVFRAERHRGAAATTHQTSVEILEVRPYTTLDRSHTACMSYSSDKCLAQIRQETALEQSIYYDRNV